MRAWPESAKTAAGDTEERPSPIRREGPGDVEGVEPEAQEGQVSAGRTGIETLYCSFCGTSQYEAQLLAGPTVFICDDCVWTCMEVLADLPEDMPAPLSGGVSLSVVCEHVNLVRQACASGRASGSCRHGGPGRARAAT